MNQFGAADLKRAFLAGTAALNSHKDYVNELNVFPVPDGDTGTNMSMTLNSAACEVAKLPDDADMATLCKAISSGTLRGARGNSGVILSQLLRGFCKELKEYDSVDTILLASAFARAVDSAYKAVMKPKEGTILTVARSMSESAAEHAVVQDDIRVFMELVLADGRISLENTPELLPVLKEAGVVDSGGQGLIYAMEGALAGLLDESYVYDPEGGASKEDESARKARAEAEALEEKLKSRYSYMTQATIIMCLCKDEEADVKAKLEEHGSVSSCTVDAGHVSVRVYTDDPGLVLHTAMSYGELSGVTVHNISREGAEGEKNKSEKASSVDAARDGAAGSGVTHDGAAHGTAGEAAGAHIGAAGADPAADAATSEGSTESSNSSEEHAKDMPHKQFGFVTVAAGEGLEEIFRSLGADVIISGGQTMNPCTQDFLKAIDDINADDIYLIPNNKNIIMAAEQAASLQEGKNVYVVPTTTIPQGITALISFDQCSDGRANADAMTQAAGCVKTCEVTYAVRDTNIDGFCIHENDIMAIADGKMSAVGRSIDDTVSEAMGKLVDDSSELVSIYYGADVKPEEAEALCARISQELSSVDVEVHAGGQPVYFYLISVE